MAVPYPKKGMHPKKVKVGISRLPTKKQQDSIKTSKQYYRSAIESNVAQNKGKCVCENCDVIIAAPTGSNVSHIISKGANRALYFDPINHFILCMTCEACWTSFDKSQMAIYAESEERRIEINKRYYTR